MTDLISNDPQGPVDALGRRALAAVVRWVLNGTIAAEALGVTSKNVDEMKAKSTSAEVRRLLGAEGGFGAMMGLSNDWMYNAIKQVGNYGESYERTVGMGSPLKLERGKNELWTKGGLLFTLAVPMRAPAADARTLAPPNAVLAARTAPSSPDVRSERGSIAAALQLRMDPGSTRLRPHVRDATRGSECNAERVPPETRATLAEGHSFLNDKRSATCSGRPRSPACSAVVFFVVNASRNMRDAGIASGFDFLLRTSGIEVPFV